MKADLDPWLAEARTWTDGVLERVFATSDGVPAGLDGALRYAVFGGGKRLRPALVRMVCEAQGGSADDAALPAAAVELLHTYSLVHDDLPCMDDDDLRRGRPTCHKVYGEGVAVLVGDGLLTLAFELLGRCERGAAMVGVLARSAGPAGMVGGQALDLDAEVRRVGADEVRRIHAMKTAALFAASAELGVLAGPPAVDDDHRRSGMARFGALLGLCFQAVDDVLDVTGDAATLGKTPGKDEARGKATLVSTLGIEAAQAEAASLAAQAREAALAAGCKEGGLPLALLERLLARQS